MEKKSIFKTLEKVKKDVHNTHRPAGSSPHGSTLSCHSHWSGRTAGAAWASRPPHSPPQTALPAHPWWH